MPMHYHIILDAASMDGAIFQAREESKEYKCLFIGDSEITLASVAPWLFPLETSTHFAEWLADHAPKNNWGIIIESDMDLKALHRHLRHFMVVHDPRGKEMFFRFFDPRVLRIFLPVCTQDQLREFFGSISTFIVEDEEGMLIRFSFSDGLLKEESMNVDLAYHLTDIDFDHQQGGLTEPDKKDKQDKQDKDDKPSERWNFG